MYKPRAFRPRCETIKVWCEASSGVPSYSRHRTGSVKLNSRDPFSKGAVSLELA